MLMIICIILLCITLHTQREVSNCERIANLLAQCYGMIVDLLHVSVFAANYIYHKNLVPIFLLYSNVCLVAYNCLISKLRSTLL